MDKKDEFSAEHIQPREDLELQQRYSNRDVSSKAQMYVQKIKEGGEPPQMPSFQTAL